ncbi:MAG: hypothetical protein D6718_05255 [Acidobacteria bacterium]|nr:MAG: hypothetical protein D6718_05255 [Acidobacteriota bacterium]
MKRRWWIALVLPLMLVPARAGGEDGDGEIVAGALFSIEDGDRGRFLEHAGGLDDRPFLDVLRWRLADAERAWSLEAAATAGRSGWFDLERRGRRLRLAITGTFHSGWSDTSFADDRLPSGTAVATLVPPTTELPGFFGVGKPHDDRYRFELVLSGRLRGADRIALRLSAAGHDGERVPSIGGFSFADNGLPATYAAGLETFDSSIAEAELTAKLRFGRLDLRLAGGLAGGDARSAVRLPAWGTAELIDVNAWSDRTEFDETWVRAGAVWPVRNWTLQAHADYTDATFTPEAFDRREQPSGTPLVAGLATHGGDVERSRLAGAVGAVWSPSPKVRITLAADAADTDQTGAVALDLAGAPYGLAQTSYQDSRAGLTARGSFRLSRVRLTAEARFQSAERTIDERDPASLADLERDTDLLRLRARAWMPLGRMRIEGWARLEDRSTDVTIRDLTDGYATGGRDVTTTAAGIRVRRRSGPLQAGLGVRWEKADLDVDRPLFDPVFDPSVVLEPVDADHRLLRISGSLSRSGERGAVWAEAGWTNLEWTFPREGVRPSYAPVSEEVDGLYAAVGGETPLWRRGTLRGSAERVEQTSDLDLALTRAEVEVSQRLKGMLALFLRWSFWDFSAGASRSDEYTFHLLSAGLRSSW